MNATQKDKEYYLTVWEEMLHGLLGWSQADVLRWSRESGKSKHLDNPEDALYHESPVYWAVDLLIPDALWRELAPLQKVLIRRDLLQALDHGQQYTIPTNTNWNSYTAKLEQILGQFGAILPRSMVHHTFQESHAACRRQGATKGSQDTGAGNWQNLTHSQFKHYPHAV